MTTSRAFAPLPLRASYFAGWRGSIALAYDEIERLTGRVETWECETIRAAAVLTEDAETLTRRVHGLIAGPHSPRRRAEEEMARVARRIAHLEHAWAEPYRGMPFLSRLALSRLGRRIQLRCGRVGNKAMGRRVLSGTGPQGGSV